MRNTQPEQWNTKQKNCFHSPSGNLRGGIEEAQHPLTFNPFRAYEEIGRYIWFCDRTDREEKALDVVSKELEDMERSIHAGDLPGDEKTDLHSFIYSQPLRLHFGLCQTANQNFR